MLVTVESPWLFLFVFHLFRILECELLKLLEVLGPYQDLDRQFIID